MNTPIIHTYIQVHVQPSLVLILEKIHIFIELGYRISPYYFTMDKPSEIKTTTKKEYIKTKKRNCLEKKHSKFSKIFTLDKDCIDWTENSPKVCDNAALSHKQLKNQSIQFSIES